MGIVKFVDFTQTRIVNVGGIAADATTVDITAGDGLKILADAGGALAAGDCIYAWFKGVLANREVIKITGVVGDTLTVVRGINARFPARAWAQNDIVHFALSKSPFDDMQQSVADALAATEAALLSLGAAVTAAEDAQAAAEAAAGTAAADTLAAIANLEMVFNNKSSGDGFRVTGGALTVRPASGVRSLVSAGTIAETEIAVTAGGYTSGNDSAQIIIRSKDHATTPGTVTLTSTDGSAHEGVSVLADGTVNIPVGLQIGGVPQAKSGVFSNSPKGTPNMSDVGFNVEDLVPTSQWRSIGPTGSGADFIWATLDMVPADVHWLNIFVYMMGLGTTVTAGAGIILNARKDGTYTVNDIEKLSDLCGRIGDPGVGVKSSVTLYDMGERTIPVTERRFQVKWTGQGYTQKTVFLYLVGYGYN